MSLKEHLNDPTLLRHAAYINGEWQQSDDGKTFEVIDPSNGQPPSQDGEASRRRTVRVLPPRGFLIATACLTIPRTLPRKRRPGRAAVGARPPREGASNDGDCSQISKYGVRLALTIKTLGQVSFGR